MNKLVDMHVRRIRLADSFISNDDNTLNWERRFRGSVSNLFIFHSSVSGCKIEFACYRGYCCINRLERDDTACYLNSSGCPAQIVTVGNSI